MMRNWILAGLLVCLAFPALAQERVIGRIVDQHILPRYQTLTDQTQSLAAQAAKDCTPENGQLIAAYHDAFDAWVGVSHLRFGPSEQEDRAFALAFWPDPRGSTPKTLLQLFRDEDPVVRSSDGFATVSIAGRGFYALEHLLFAPEFSAAQNAGYHCALVVAVTRDIAANAKAILEGWRDEYAVLMADPGNDTYRTETEAAQQVFTALTTGLEFTENMRLGRPLGTFDRPRPNRAEARRSGRSLRHVQLSLLATRELALILTKDDTNVAGDFDRALSRLSALEDPVFSGVADPAKRFRIEALQNDVLTIRRNLLEDVGPGLGITAGFNSLDGD